MYHTCIVYTTYIYMYEIDITNITWYEVDINKTCKRWYSYKANIIFRVTLPFFHLLVLRLVFSRYESHNRYLTHEVQLFDYFLSLITEKLSLIFCLNRQNMTNGILKRLNVV